MSEAIPASYNPFGRLPALPTVAGVIRRSVHPSPCNADARPRSNAGEVRPHATTSSRWLVREDNPYEIPDIDTGGADELDYEQHQAAAEHAEHLHDAQRDLDEAQNLVAVLLASLEGEGDSRAMQAEAVLQIVDSRIRRAHEQLDRHADRHSNLFFAYFDLRDRSQAEEGDED